MTTTQVGFGVGDDIFEQWQQGNLTDVQALTFSIEELNENDIARFKSKTEQSNDCWSWNGTHNSDGYGQAWVLSRHTAIGAHRVAYVIAHGGIPKGLHVLHDCDNPGCVNPNHLFLGTHQDNMIDKEKKGRGNRILRDANGRGRSFKDLTGRKFGKLTAIKIVGQEQKPNGSPGHYIWLCQCDCGGTKEVASATLTGEKTASCGCLRREVGIKNILGQRFGLLQVVALKGSAGGSALWECICDCGNTKILRAANLNHSTGSRSCGCRQGNRQKGVQ